MRLWGGRFSKDPNELALRFSQSLPFDQRLAECDIEGSIAHARMLGRCRIVTREEARRLEAGLGRIRAALTAGEIKLDPSSEDIHTEIERLLFEQVGPLAGKLHTARSRNDQVALDLRLYLREEIDHIRREVRALLQVLLDLAERHLGAPMPGYTHTQLAQPVLLSQHLMAYFWMFQRDRERLADCRRRVNLCPLGAAALGGTSFPIDPVFVAELLGFDGLCPNSMDAVSDRDFLVEFLAVSAIAMTHLSQLANEIVLWSTTDFGFLHLDDAWCTGSSIMPQKRNPDPAELVRGKSGRTYGHLLAALTVLKGLPLTYNLDLQEDKEALFDTLDTLRPCLNVMCGMLATATFDTERMAAAAGRGFSTATEVADYLVRKGIPFREAHGIVGQIVRYCEKQAVTLDDLSLAEWRSFSKEFGEDCLDIISPIGAIEAKRSPGGTAPERVKEQIQKARKILED